MLPVLLRFSFDIGSNKLRVSTHLALTSPAYINALTYVMTQRNVNFRARTRAEISIIFAESQPKMTPTIGGNLGRGHVKKS